MPQPKGREPGVYFITMEEYHNDPAIGSSGIKDILISPETFWFNSNLNPDREQFDANQFKVGRAYHLMVLEPEKEFPFKIKTGVRSSGVPGMFGEGDYWMLQRMYQRLLRAPKHWNALHGGIPECSIFFRDKQTGLMCKIRPDNFAPEWVADLKTCNDVSDRALRFDFVKFGYYISGTMYSEGMQALKEMIRAGYKMPPEFSEDFLARFMAKEKQMFCFVLQEKDTPTYKSPYTTRLWNMTPYVSELGHFKFVKGLAIYQEHQHNLGQWPSGYPEVEDITEDMVSASINY